MRAAESSYRRAGVADAADRVRGIIVDMEKLQ
jgi:hypothetical protein